MPELRWLEADEARRVRLDRSPLGIGRASDNQIVLKDFSVSRHHARVEQRGESWWAVDLGSTNGIKVNGRYLTESPLADGDELQVGNFALTFQRGDSGQNLAVSSSTFLRPLEEFREDFHLEREPAKKKASISVSASARERVLEALAQVARTLLEVDELEPVLEKVMEAIFDQLPAERAYVLLFTATGSPQLRIARSRGGTTLEDVPVSQTILDLVTRQKVAVLTSDAQADERFSAGMSVRLHQIRSAMCAPLWLRDSVIGVLFVDTPLATGCFGPEHLDLLTALANYAAVAIDRARLNDSIRESKRVRERMERYHSPAVVEAIVSHRLTDGAERHETREVTVLFADIVGFTSRCEAMEPTEVARFLNEFFTLASDSVFEFGGTLDKFIGDAVMAFFGAPLEQTDHAERAVLSALMLRRRLKRWNRERELAGLDAVEVRMAINSGLVVVGEIGSANRVDYTVLGNTVNVTARLEEIVAQPGQVVIGDATQRAVAHIFPTAHLGNIQLRGLKEKMPVFRILTEELSGVGD
ncbi:MAG: adenylate/guanylate cyclase domain-containing protein [Acidobacteriota bacterium]